MRNTDHADEELLRVLREASLQLFTEDLPEPPLHEYSIVWSLVEKDPNKWN
jgi:hypothetical protein